MRGLRAPSPTGPVERDGSMMKLGIFGIVVTAVLWPGVASAQFVRQDRLTGFYVTSSQLDAYGNAQAVEPLRRNLDVYQNAAQRAAAAAYQDGGRRVQQRGGFIPFSLPADPLRQGQRSRNTTPVMPYAVNRARGISGAERIKAFRSYGGFGDRSKASYESEIQRAFARRYDLVTATADAAPVFRANLRHASAAGLLTTVDTTPFEKRGADLPDTPATDLGDALALHVRQSQQNLVRDAWGWFKDGAYRRAEMAFKSADVLEPSDTLSRIGRYFSLLGLGSMRSALSMLQEINQRDPNPFVYSLNVGDVVAERQRVAQFRVQTQMPSDAPRRAPDIAAMHAFTLWYLGERQEALSVAQAIAEASPGSPYGTWASKMNAAIAAAQSPSEGS